MLSSVDVVNLPGTADTTQQFTVALTDADSDFSGDFGIFTFQQGGFVDGLVPQSPGFDRAAVLGSTSQVLIHQHAARGTSTTISLPGGTTIGFFLVQNGTVDHFRVGWAHAFTSLVDANPDGADHVRTVRDGSRTVLFWEDLWGGGDADFNDLVVTVTVEGTFQPAAAAPVVQVPGEVGRTTPARFTLVDREASFGNELGLFLVDDATGRIGDLDPGDAGYATAALAAVRSRVLFSPGDGAGAVNEFDLEAGAFLAFYLVQDGTTDEARSANGGAPTVYFSLPAANPDGFAHVRFDGSRFIWEDQTGGGDADFDDAIVQLEFGTPTGDTTAPVVVVDQPANGAVLGESPEIRGRVTDDFPATLTASIDGRPGTSVPVLGDGSFLFDPGALGDGQHSISFVATDAAGNASPATVLTFVVDSTAPALAVRLDEESDTPPTGDLTTNLAQVDLVGETEAGLTVTLVETNAVIVAGTDGTFRFEDVPVVLGDNTFTVNTVDAAGNTATATLVVTRVSGSPVVTITAPESGQVTRDNPTITGRVEDDGGASNVTLLVSIDGGSEPEVTVNADGTFEFTPSLPTNGTANGEHTVRFIARDAGGNESAPADLVFVLSDTNTPPTVVIESPANGLVTDGNPTVTGRVTDDLPPDTVTLLVSVDGGSEPDITVAADGTFTFDLAFPLDGSANGPHTVRFIAIDADGATSTPVEFAYTLES